MIASHHIWRPQQDSNLRAAFATSRLSGPLSYRLSMEAYGGSGWNRTNGVSNVTVLQTAAIATMRTDPYWWNRLGSDQRHPELQSGALPAELRFLVAESAELESDTLCVYEPLSRRSSVLLSSLSK